MNTRVRVEEQVKDFLHTLAPDPRRAVWRAIKALPKNEGDTKQLEGKLAPYWRLRVGRVRVLYSIKVTEGERRLTCFYAGHRGTIYEVVAQLLASGSFEELSD